MRNNRLSLASLLTFILIICAFAGQQLVFAQGKKPVFQPECDPSVAKPTPGRIPLAVKPTIRPTPSRGSIFGSTPVPPRSVPNWETIRPIPQPIYRPTPEIYVGPPVNGIPNTTPLPPVAAPGRVMPSEVINKVLGYNANNIKRQSTTTLRTFTAHGRRIPIIKLSGAKPRTYYSNAIYILGSNAALLKNLDGLRKVNEDFVKMLGAKLLSDPNLRNARFMTTVKSGSDEFVTIFEVRDGKFGAIVLSLNAPAANCGINGCTMVNVFDDIIGSWLEPISGTGRLYMIGDDLEGIDPTKLATRFNCEVLRRPTRMQRSLRETESRLAQLSDRKLEAATTEFVNGLPHNEAEAVLMGYQRNEVKGLLRAAKETDKLAKRFFKQQRRSPSPPQNLQELLTKGESDVVLIVAHSDKERIYINGTPVSVDDIKNYPDRFMPNYRPRIAILLSCYGGDFRIQKGLWPFKRNVDSLAEVLVRKGYFDKVVAPRGEITPDQVKSILKDYFSGRLIRGIAANHRLLEIAEFRKRILPSAN